MNGASQITEGMATGQEAATGETVMEGDEGDSSEGEWVTTEVDSSNKEAESVPKLMEGIESGTGNQGTMEEKNVDGEPMEMDEKQVPKEGSQAESKGERLRVFSA